MMGPPNFKYDIFIRYTHIDNRLLLSENWTVREISSIGGQELLITPGISCGAKAARRC
jgi:hypothetical protein